MEAVYKGNIRINGNTIVLALFSLLSLWLLLFVRTTLVSVVIFSSAWLYIFIKCSLQVYYFALTNGCLTIKNHYIPWINVTVPFKEIQELRFEKRFKMAYSLAIRTRDKSTHYCGSTLTTAHWLKLKKDLENLGITVRNECISD